MNKIQTAKKLLRIAASLLKQDQVQAKLTKLADLTSDDTLYQLVDMEYESAGGNPGEGDFDDKAVKNVFDKAGDYENAVIEVLGDWVEKNVDKFRMGENWLENATDAEDVVDVLWELRGGAAYLYFMEAEGHGVGTWDGEWDQLFVDPKKSIKELSGVVAKHTSKQYHALEEAIMDAAHSAIPEDEDWSDR